MLEIINGVQAFCASIVNVLVLVSTLDETLESESICVFRALRVVASSVMND